MSDAITHEEGIESIRTLLSMLDRYREPPDGWVTLPHRLLLEHGRAYEVTADTYSGPRGAQGCCYRNAGRIALRDRRSRTYVEGYITCYGIPLSHAWLITDDGTVIDPTLKSGEGIAGYFGMPFATNYVARVGRETGVWGILSLESHLALFEKGLPEGALA